ncbi:MAG: hypothetical protein ACE5G9_12910 [Nitrospinales bacterium]
MDILFTIVASIVLGIGLFIICRSPDDEDDDEEEDAPDQTRNP